MVASGDSLAPASDMLKTKVAATGLTITITGDLAKRAMAVEKRARNICTNSSYSSFINSAYSEGKSLASTAASYIASRGASDSLYRAYYGSTSTTSVRSVFTNVANENSSSRTLSCTDTYGACSNGVIAYTVIATTNVYFCPIFFQEVPQTYLCTGQTSVASRNVRGGTVLHELTHATSGELHLRAVLLRWLTWPRRHRRRHLRLLRRPGALGLQLVPQRGQLQRMFRMCCLFYLLLTLPQCFST